MKFKVGDRVHVTRLYGDEVDFYATLKEGKIGLFTLFNCTNFRYENHHLWKPERHEFGEKDYYTLATDEESSKERTINNLDANAYETKLVIKDEEDSEPVEVQHIKKENKIELDNHYIIEVKKDLYVALVTSNGYLKLTKDINKADVYEYENAALKHAEFVDGRVRNLKRHVEVE